MKSISLSLILIILLFKQNLTNEKKYLLIPFTVQQEKVDSYQKYDSSIFIRNNFYKNITFNFYIGNPPQKVDGILLNDNLCFEIRLEKDLYTYNNIYSYINNKYIPKDSSTFSLKHEELRWDKGIYMTLGSDTFSFGNNEEKYNLTFMLGKANKESIDIDEVKSQKYIVKFGLNVLTSFSGDECPNFILFIRNKAKLNKFLTSYVFTSANSGYLVVGDELYKYNPKIYHQSQHVNIYTSSNCPIEYNEGIVIDEVNGKNITLNKTKIYLEYDLGVIIGTNQYKQIIDEIFFDKLISNKICQIETVKLNSSDEYYVYSCKEENFNIKQFPKLLFISRRFAFVFELNYNDIFSKKANGIYYFLILFKENNGNNNNTNVVENWGFGEPFYRKYNFTLNLDSRMLGFYNPNYDYEEEKEINVDNNNKDEGDNNIWKIIIFIVLGCIFIGLLMLLSFYLGMKIKEGRKKRANELKEDNYEYFPEKEENKLFN